MLEPIPFAGYVEIDNDKSLVEQAPYHPGYEDAGFQPKKIKELSDAEIAEVSKDFFLSGYIPYDFVRAIIKKAQEK
jgi:hypothetical protein